MIRKEVCGWSLDLIKDGKKRTVGTRETRKALEKGLLEGIFIAMDAEHRLVKPLIAAAKASGISIYYVETMKKLGAVCEVEVDTAIAGVLKQEN